jgi:hypothetical protein
MLKTNFSIGKIGETNPMETTNMNHCKTMMEFRKDFKAQKRAKPHKSLAFAHTQNEKYYFEREKFEMR